MNDDKKYWLDDAANVRKIIIGVVVICAGLLAADFFYDKHATFSIEGWYGFYGIYGFIVFCAIVLIGKELRKILMRDEDYYDE
ncbi:MAG: hypothetical protein HQ483_03955 [Rhodospirillales bacterium]|nr:hypothetical protein [Rhodospirillales bacterium]